MDKKKFGIINMETGEIVESHRTNYGAVMSMDRDLTKEDLYNLDGDMIRYIFRAGKIDGTIDKFGMIKVDGLYVSKEYFEAISELGQYGHILANLKLALSFRGFVKKTNTSDIKAKSELYKILKYPKDKRRIAIVNKVIKKYDIIREHRKLNGDKVFVVNPNMIRNGTHTSDFSIAVFKDVTLKNIDRYNQYLIHLNGLIEFDDLAF